MPKNKNALIRYEVLDNCFSNWNRKYFMEDLIEAVNNKLAEEGIHVDGIKRRQIYNDMEFMEKYYGVVIKKHRENRRTYYRYEDKSMSIKFTLPSNIEYGLVKAIVARILHLDAPELDDKARAIIAELLDKFARKQSNKPIIILDYNEYVQGAKFIEPLFNAIYEKKPLRITYQRYREADPVTIIFHPYVIRQYNYRWFVIGRHEQEQASRWVLALDRIKEIEEENTIPYKESPVENWKDYFEDLIGVTWPEGERPQEVKLVFTQEFAPYIQTKPLHPSQKAKQLPDGRLEVRIYVVLNYELENLILSFGQHVSVVSPEVLRDRIKNRLQQALLHYA